MENFYKKFIKPLSKETDQAEREIVLNYLLVGIFALAVVALLDTLLAPVISNETPHWNRVINNVVTVLFIVGLYVAARYKGRHKAAGIVLTGLITLMSCSIAFHWGVLLPTGLLLLSLAVVMAGVLIGARYSLYVTCLLVVVIAYLQHGESTGSLHPDLSWVGTKPTPGDVIGFSAILFVIALVSWLFNRQMELSLRRAQRSEKALKQQKQLLEIKVEKRAQQLEAAQLEKMQELYRFAELGRLSTALFHDLANHLSTVSLDIEGLTAKDQSGIMKRISQNVGHIDTIVKRVREQIRGKSSIEVFNVLNEIEEVVKIMAPAAEQAAVTIVIRRDSQVKPSLSYRGDVTRFRQIILNLISNGIEAYPPSPGPTDGQPRSVLLHLGRQQTVLSITVTDQGVGIAKKEQFKIFRPFYTTKDKGVGIGLFIVKQVVEHDFGGTIMVSSDKQQGTTISVSLPKSYYARVSTN
jgi:signal transduction histidine kinase